MEPMEEHDFAPRFAHRHVEVARVSELLGELRELVIMGCEDRLAPDRVVQELGHGPRDRDAVVCRRPPSDLVEQHEAPRRRAVEYRTGLAHLHHERRLTAHQIVRRPHPREQAVHGADDGPPAVVCTRAIAWATRTRNASTSCASRAAIPSSAPSTLASYAFSSGVTNRSAPDSVWRRS